MQWPGARRIRRKEGRPIPSIVVIGSLNMDLTVRVPRLPIAGETILGSDVYQAPGGKGGNQAVAAARLGGRVRIIARVGRDAFGDVLTSSLEREGVDVSAVGVADAPTGAAMIVVDDSGQNQLAVVPGANAHLSPEDVDRAWGPDRPRPGESPTPVPWTLAQLEVPEAAVLRAFQRAREGGGRTILNAAPARPVSLELWRCTGIVVVNETEAAALALQPAADVLSAEAAARVLRSRGPSTVAITLGAAGSVVVSGEGTWHIPAIPVRAVDATAAGDAWVGAFAVALAEGRSVTDAATFASAAGALAVTRAGAQPSLPGRQETEDLARRAPAPRRLS